MYNQIALEYAVMDDIYDMCVDKLDWGGGFVPAFEAAKKNIFQRLWEGFLNLCEQIKRVFTGGGSKKKKSNDSSKPDGSNDKWEGIYVDKNGIRYEKIIDDNGKPALLKINDKQSSEPKTITITNNENRTVKINHSGDYIIVDGKRIKVGSSEYDAFLKRNAEVREKLQKIDNETKQWNEIKQKEALADALREAENAAREKQKQEERTKSENLKKAKSELYRAHRIALETGDKISNLFQNQLQFKVTEIFHLVSDMVKCLQGLLNNMDTDARDIHMWFSKGDRIRSDLAKITDLSGKVSNLFGNVADELVKVTNSLRQTVKDVESKYGVIVKTETMPFKDTRWMLTWNYRDKFIEEINYVERSLKEYRDGFTKLDEKYVFRAANSYMPSHSEANQKYYAESQKMYKNIGNSFGQAYSEFNKTSSGVLKVMSTQYIYVSLV